MEASPPIVTPRRTSGTTTLSLAVEVDEQERERQKFAHFFGYIILDYGYKIMYYGYMIDWFERVLKMNKQTAIDQAFRISTLTEPTEEIRLLLGALEFERVLELLLMLRQSPKKVVNPAGFLRRAIQEGWKAGQQPQKLDRRLENTEERIYQRRGYTPEQARQAVQEGRQKGWGL